MKITFKNQIVIITGSNGYLGSEFTKSFLNLGALVIGIDKDNNSKLKFKNLNYSKLSKYNLHTPENSKFTSTIARSYSIREILKKYQIHFSKINKYCCIEGRDISTKILPNSDIKFYFKCKLNIAAIRRYKELKKEIPNINLRDVKKALRMRNISDTNRKNSPLLKHRDSIVIDTGKLNKKAMIAKMTKHIKEKLR